MSRCISSVAAGLLAVLAVSAGCARGGGSAAPVATGRWGPIPPGPRGPGQAAAVIAPTIEVVNPGPERTETLRASVPFSWGVAADPASWSIGGQPTAWLVLQRWPDRTVRLAQAQWTETLAAASAVQRPVVAQPTSLWGAFQPHAVFSGGVPELGAEVVDPFGVVYAADVAGPGVVVQESALVRVTRWREYHQAVVAGTGIGRDYLTSTFYVTEFRDQPIVLVDWLPGNDYLGADQPGVSTDPNLYPLGGVDVDAARFRCRGFDVVLPYRAASEDIASPTIGLDGYTRFQTMSDTYLSDGQMRRYRFLLLRDDPAANPVEQAAARVSAQAMIEHPLQPLADHDSLRASHALGLLGGPGPAPSDAAVRAASDYDSWLQHSEFGTWGSRGDPALTSTTGTPRNHPLTPELAHAVQSRDLRLLEVLEQKAWTQAARPYHLHGLRVEDADDLLLWDGVPIFPGSRDLSRESLGRRLLFTDDPWPAYRSRVTSGGDHAHGFSPFDLEHWSMDLLFDYWSISGDAWARDEMRQLGESLRGVLRPAGYATSVLHQARSEGWAMQALVQAFLATDDVRFRDGALDRLHDIVDRDRAKGHPSKAVRINDGDVRTGWPLPHRFYMPWQHGAILFGYLAGWKFFGDPLFLTICDDVTQCVEYGWVQNVQHPQLGFIAEGLRYYVPTESDNVEVPPWHFDAAYGLNVGSHPLNSVHTLLVAGLLMHAGTTTDSGARARSLHYGELLLQAPVNSAALWSRWIYCVPSEWLQ